MKCAERILKSTKHELCPICMDDCKEKRAHSSAVIHFIPNAYSHGLKRTTTAHAVVPKFQK